MINKLIDEIYWTESNAWLEKFQEQDPDLRTIRYIKESASSRPELAFNYFTSLILRPDHEIIDLLTAPRRQPDRLIPMPIKYGGMGMSMNEANSFIQENLESIAESLKNGHFSSHNNRYPFSQEKKS